MSNAASKLTSNLDATDAPPVAVTTAATRKEYLITLDDNDNIAPTGQFFGVNGRSWILRSGEEAWVPEGIIDLLENAVETRPIKDGQQRVVGSRNRHRFPYHVHKTRDVPIGARV